VLFATLQSGALEAVEKLINRALQYDPATLRDIAGLNGKLVLIDSTLPVLRIALETTDNGIMLHSNWQDDADVTVSGSLVSMLAMAARKDAQFSFADSGVNVKGDLLLLSKINILMSTLNVDWEAALGAFVGDIPAHLMAESVRKSAAMASDIGRRSKTAAVEIAQEELRLTPTATEFDHFAQGVRQLSSSVERSAARVGKLRHQLALLLANQSPSPESKL